MYFLTQTARLIETLKRFRIVQLFTIYLRYLIGAAFVFPSVPKILGQRFTSISTDDPAGFFFEAMYRTGFYWNFLGWAQLVAALLLMTQRFAVLGAMCFFPIILNIWLITWSLAFKGTWLITFLMWLANLYLLVWDYRRFLPLLQPETKLSLMLSEFDDAFMRKPLWIWLGLLLAAAMLGLKTDFEWMKFVLGGVIILVGGIGLYQLFRKN
jgi:hypothetical protein